MSVLIWVCVKIQGAPPKSVGSLWFPITPTPKQGPAGKPALTCSSHQDNLFELISKSEDPHGNQKSGSPKNTTMFTTQAMVKLTCRNLSASRRQGQGALQGHPVGTGDYDVTRAVMVIPRLAPGARGKRRTHSRQNRKNSGGSQQ